MRDVLKDINKVIIDKTGQSGVVPYLPLNELMKQRRTTTPDNDNTTPPPSVSTPQRDRNPETSDRFGGQQ